MKNPVRLSRTSLVLAIFAAIILLLGLGQLSRLGMSAQSGPLAGQPGVVAAYGFEEGVGSTTADATGNGNAGTLSGTTWSTAGRYGKALSFNGTSSLVSIPDTGILDATIGMTVEAWIRPTTGAQRS